MTTCICLSYTGPTPLGSTIQLTCNPSGTIINESTVNLTTNCPYCITVPSGTTTITAFDPVTNCTEVIPVEPVTDTPCSSGMDVVFCVDYTSSMGPALDGIKQKIAVLTETIELLSQNNYRLGLVLFDEFNVPNPLYANSYTYTNLPPSQKYVNSNVTISKYQFITAMEIMSPNNQTSFVQNLFKLNSIIPSRLHKLFSDGTQSPEICIKPNSPPQFGPPNSTVNTIKLQSDGKLLYGGFFTNTNTYSVSLTTNRICRLNSNGSIDTTFITAGGFSQSVDSIDVNNLGQIIVGGDFITYQGITVNRIALLSSGGGLLNFNYGSGFNSQVTVVKFDLYGNVLVGGNFITYNTSSRNRIVRLLNDGTIDPSFIIGNGLNGVPLAIEVEPITNNIYVGGAFSNYNMTPRNCIVKLTNTGAIDPSFIIGSGFGSTVRALKLQPNGQILAGGNFVNYNTTPCNKIMRLNPDGSPDLLFATNIGIGFNNDVYSIDLQSDGKIIVGGIFTSFNNQQRSRIVRLNSDGTLDNSFGSCGLQVGFSSGIVKSLSVNNQNEIFVACDGTYNSNCYPGMTEGSGEQFAEPSDMAIDRIVNYNFAGSFNPSNSKYIILITDNPPSGNDDFANTTDLDFINNVLVPSCVANNIKFILVRPSNQPVQPEMSYFFPLITATGGEQVLTPFNTNFSVNQVATTLATLC